jgi:hypothetical protein
MKPPFIWAEADMLDRLDYKSWLPLWVEDDTIPVEHDADDFEPAQRRP